MTITIRYDQLLLFSEEQQKFFFTEFSKGANIIYGRNTAGKSTLFLLILYCFGINDGNQHLKEILDEKIVLRLDVTFEQDETTKKIVFIRDDDTLFIKQENIPLKRFNGINANNSVEHIKLKQYLNELFGFSLQLESKSELKAAPVETMFLPYYVSQSVGWVYLRKSFSSLDYYKNFKEDYLDYYLGLDASYDRVERHALQKQLKEKDSEIALIAGLEIKNEDIALTKLTDEHFIVKSNQYIQEFSEKHGSLTKKENNYVLKCNALAFLQERKSTLSRVAKNHKDQQPGYSNCPTCEQSLPFGISETYKYLQEQNDTNRELLQIRSKIKATQSSINSLQNQIAEEREVIAKEFATLNKYYNSNISYDTWLKNKSNVQLITNLHQKIGELTVQREKIKEDLGKYQTDEEIEKARTVQGNAFKVLFVKYLGELKVKVPSEERYRDLYSISAFPSQGVELHKTVMAYHFAFNDVINRTPNIHRLPFMLDAIFKEDLDDENKALIPKFIAKNSPKDTQIIFSIAQAEGQVSNASYYNRTYFDSQAKLIQVSDGIKERSLLRDYKGEMPEYIEETSEMINGTSS